MNKFFKEELLNRLSVYYSVDECDQDEIKDIISRNEENDFPMICFEHTDDSDFEVGIDDSKFLNDESHEGFWVVGEDDGVSFIFNLKEMKDILEIDVFEVNAQKRNNGIGANVVTLIECCAEPYYNTISLSPFDTNAINFWEHLEYTESNNGYWIKNINEDYFE